LTVNPDGRLHAQANRAFLRRVVRHLADAGIDQFLDLGSGGWWDRLRRPATPTRIQATDRLGQHTVTRPVPRRHDPAR
jgi:hypothetical protein